MLKVDLRGLCPVALSKSIAQDALRSRYKPSRGPLSPRAPSGANSRSLKSAPNAWRIWHRLRTCLETSARDEKDTLGRVLSPNADGEAARLLTSGTTSEPQSQDYVIVDEAHDYRTAHAASSTAPARSTRVLRVGGGSVKSSGAGGKGALPLEAGEVMKIRGERNFSQANFELRAVPAASCPCCG